MISLVRLPTSEPATGRVQRSQHTLVEQRNVGCGAEPATSRAADRARLGAVHVRDHFVADGRCVDGRDGLLALRHRLTHRDDVGDARMLRLWKSDEEVAEAQRLEDLHADEVAVVGSREAGDEFGE